MTLERLKSGKLKGLFTNDDYPAPHAFGARQKRFAFRPAIAADGERELKSGLWFERALVLAAPAALCAQEA